MGTNDINLIETKTISPIAEPVDPVNSTAPAAAGGSSVRPDSQAAAASGSGEITLKPIKNIYDM